jgi:hypothetical protein
MASRRADDKPETKADKKFFDLRESGYKVDDLDKWIKDHS